MPAEGGEPRNLHSLPGEVCQGIAWLPQGERLLLLTASALWVMPAEGGEPQRIEGSKPPGTSRLIGLRLHPDGRQVVLTAGTGLYAAHSEVWVMENFLPEMTAAK